MSFSSKDFISNSKYSVSIVEIVDRFWSKVLFNINWVPFFKLDIKWIFGNICWKSVEECTTIISCVASYIGTYLSYVLRKCGKKENGPVFKVVIEKLIRSHTDCKQGISTVLCDLSCYFNYPLFRSPGYFFYCFRAEVFKYVLLYKVKNRAYFHLLPIFYKYSESSFKRRRYPFLIN